MKKLLLVPVLFVLFSALASAHCGSCGTGDQAEAKSCSSEAKSCSSESMSCSSKAKSCSSKAKASGDAKKSSSKKVAAKSCCG